MSGWINEQYGSRVGNRGGLMYRFNIPVPPEEDFPEVIVAQRTGEGFKKEYVEYEPRWRFDKMRRIVVVDEKYFYAMVDTSERLKVENTKLREYINLKEICWKYVGWCDECPYNGADDEHDDFNCMVQEKTNLLACELKIKMDR